MYTATGLAADLDEDYSAGIGLWPPAVDFGLDRLARDNYLARIKLETGASLHSHLALFGGVLPEPVVDRWPSAAD